MIVVSQTCDIGATGPGRRHPWVLASPLVNVTESTSLNDVLDWRFTYMAPVDSCPDPGTWAADLRLIVPVHKSVLLAHPPHRAYSAPGNAVRFAEFVATKFRRPALDPVVSEDVRIIFDDALKEAREASWVGEVEQIRVENRGDRLSPTGAVFHVLSYRELDASEKEPLRTAFDKVQKVLKKNGIRRSLIKFSPLGKVTAERYRETVPLGLREIHGPPWW